MPVRRVSSCQTLWHDPVDNDAVSEALVVPRSHSSEAVSFLASSLPSSLPSFLRISRKVLGKAVESGKSHSARAGRRISEASSALSLNFSSSSSSTTTSASAPDWLVAPGGGGMVAIGGPNGLNGNSPLVEAPGPLTRHKDGSYVTTNFSNDSVDSFGSKSSVFSAPAQTNFTGMEGLSPSTESDVDSSSSSFAEPVFVPACLRKGVPLLRITHRKQTRRIFRIDPEAGIVYWDTKTSSRLSVDRIYAIRTGEDARNYRLELKGSDAYESQWASIVFSNNENQPRVLHVVGANGQAEFDLFISVLRHLVKYRQDLMSGLAVPGDRFVLMHFSRFADDKDRTELSFAAIEKMSRALHINCPHDYLEKTFLLADEDCSGSLNPSEFHHFVELIKFRPEIASIYSTLVDESDEYLSFEKLMEFVANVQKQDVDEDTVRKQFDRFSHSPEGLSLSEFSDLMASSNLFPPLKPTLEDLDRPLNEYFISSSHNTYLVGRQVVGASSIEQYIRALQNGCRCIEIDCWDGDNGPIVCHGRAFTSSVDFKDVVTTIRKYGFITSPYPLILSLEVRCNAENQLKMVDILKNCLDEYLVTEPLMTNALTLPSPNELKHRILIKVKSASRSSSTSTKGFSSSASSTATATDTQSSSTDTFGSTTASGYSDTDTNANSQSARQRKKDQPTKIIKPLADLGVYLSGVKFRNFSLPVSKTVNHCFSLSERVANSMLRDPEKVGQLDKHNRRFLMRVYPSGYRVTSKNFDPIPYWRHGVQMVALNWQTNDIGFQLNEALFYPSIGYVHKPSSLLTTAAKMHQQSSAGTSRLSKFLTSPLKSLGSGSCTSLKTLEDTRITFSLTVISAQQLPRPKGMKADESFNPYVVVEMYGVHGGGPEPEKQAGTGIALAPPKRKRNETSVPAQHRFRTDSVLNNGFNPAWNSTWTVKIRPEDYHFAFIRFSIRSDDQTFAVYVARLSNLAQGYRHLPLHDLQGEMYIFSTLFIKCVFDHEM